MSELARFPLAPTTQQCNQQRQSATSAEVDLLIPKPPPLFVVAEKSGLFILLGFYCGRRYLERPAH
jgi:hypothetical protein